MAFGFAMFFGFVFPPYVQCLGAWREELAVLHALLFPVLAAFIHGAPAPSSKQIKATWCFLRLLSKPFQYIHFSTFSFSLCRKSCKVCLLFQVSQQTVTIFYFSCSSSSIMLSLLFRGTLLDVVKIESKICSISWMISSFRNFLISFTYICSRK